MKTHSSKKNQRGVTLFVGIVILLLMTIIAIGAFTVSNSNLKAVANMQYKNESISAANKAIEQLISSSFTDAPVAETINVDINNDGKTDYIVAIAKPLCVRAAKESVAGLSSVTLGTAMNSMANWETLWKIEAVVSDPNSGTSTTVESGVRVLLTQTQKDAVCL